MILPRNVTLLKVLLFILSSIGHHPKLCRPSKHLVYVCILEYQCIILQSHGCAIIINIALLLFRPVLTVKRMWSKQRSGIESEVNLC